MAESDLTLNAAQQRAAAHTDGPMLVLAGPGTGKTAVITERTCRLVREGAAAPGAILVVTFTRAAAAEMRQRISAKLGRDSAGLSIGTFHGIFYGILRAECHLRADSILSGSERRRLIEELVVHRSHQFEQADELPDQVGSEISALKGSTTRLSDFYSAVLPAEVFREIYRAYEQYLGEHNRIDFDDMIRHTRQLFLTRPEVLARWQKKFRFILVDEFQDISPMQYEIIRMLAEPEQNLFIVGDDDQSIYRFRGANPELMLNFQKQYPNAQIVTLDRNYRCTSEILSCSQTMIAGNRRRYAKQLTAARGRGTPVSQHVFADTRAETSWIAREIRGALEHSVRPEEIAVLFRINTGCRGLVEQLIADRIPFHAVDLIPSIYDHWIAKQVLAYLEVAAGSRRRRDFLMIANRPNRYLSRKAFPREQVSFEALYACYREQNWMCDRIRQLEHDLRVLASLPPYGALLYLEKVVGYGGFLREYAAEHRIREADLLDVFEELKERASSAGSLEEWKQQIAVLREQLSRREQQEGVTVSTLHASKGCEYEMVFIADVNEGMIPWHRARLEADLEEERRMLYVGMTRAKNVLHLCTVKKRFEKTMHPSRFLASLEIPSDSP